MSSGGSSAHPRVTHEGATFRLRKHYSLIHDVGLVSAITHILGTDPSSGATDVVDGSVAAPRHKPEDCTLGNSSAFPCHQATRLCWAGMACRATCAVTGLPRWLCRPHGRGTRYRLGTPRHRSASKVRRTKAVTLTLCGPPTRHCCSSGSRLCQRRRRRHHPQWRDFLRSKGFPCLDPVWDGAAVLENHLCQVGKQTLAPVGEACTITGRRTDAC